MRWSNVQKLSWLSLVVGLLALGCGDDNKVAGLPVADAGYNRTVQANAETRLDGTASYDPDGKTLTYAWSVVTKPENSVAELFGPTTAEPAITPDLGGNYLFSLVVNNGQRDSRPAVVALEVLGGSQNAAPFASAVCAPTDCKIKHGTTTPTTAGAVFRLDGRASYDPNSDPITYKWTQITSGANCGLCTDAGFTCDPTVTATADFPNSTYDDTKSLAEIEAPMAVGIMIFRLEVTDTGGLVDSTCLRVESTDNEPLSIVTMPATPVNEGASITLDGGSSGDEDAVDAANITYQWTHSPPTAKVVYTPNATSANVTAKVHGLTADTTVTFTLTVSDGLVTSDPCGSSACGRSCCGNVVMPVTDVALASGACTFNSLCSSGFCACADAACTARACSTAGCVCQYDAAADGVCDNNLNNGYQYEDCQGAQSCNAGACS